MSVLSTMRYHWTVSRSRYHGRPRTRKRRRQRRRVGHAVDRCGEDIQHAGWSRVRSWIDGVSTWCTGRLDVYIQSSLGSCLFVSPCCGGSTVQKNCAYGIVLASSAHCRIRSIDRKRLKRLDFNPRGRVVASIQVDRGCQSQSQTCRDH